MAKPAKLGLNMVFVSGSKCFRTWDSGVTSLHQFPSTCPLPFSPTLTSMARVCAST
ncbi:hypothetical protein COLO4_23858 [Corchorus olitorius]|uniref:Uncharacterized protein n=1 Tax=Corchorus olitorius TaxID=93759 RepID=A0A1R3IEC4_9ROSI|nr:hypothetical protein COLO4_23858 [Corchorus olitorius]